MTFVQDDTQTPMHTADHQPLLKRGKERKKEERQTDRKKEDITNKKNSRKKEVEVEIQITNEFCRETKHHHPLCHHTQEYLRHSHKIILLAP